MNANSKIGMLHATFGLVDGVSIVMQQIEDVCVGKLGVSRKNIFYLVGGAGNYSDRVKIHKSFNFEYELNKLIELKYQTGLSEDEWLLIEKQISLAEIVLDSFVEENKLNVLIAHNTCYPVNFILALALSRFYAKRKEQNIIAPKYVVWWHDSHLERVSFAYPDKKIKQYLLEGVPGPYVDEIVFINSQQYETARNYFAELDKLNQGFSKKIENNHSVIYNTSDSFIDNVADLDFEIFDKKVSVFLEDFQIEEKLKMANSSVTDTLFVLQHTRMVDRKKIDFALEYSFELLDELKKRGLKKSLYFLVSGNNTGTVRKKLETLYSSLLNKYDFNDLFLEFVEDYTTKTTLLFLDYPLIFAKMCGLTTYFSSVEGFGNNLLEVLAAGMIPVVYEYPVFKTDIKQFNFNLVSIDEFVIDNELIDSSIDLLINKELQHTWANENIQILNRNLSHSSMAKKLDVALRPTLTKIKN